MIFNIFISNSISHWIDTTVGLLNHVNTFHVINFIVNILFCVMHFLNNDICIKINVINVMKIHLYDLFFFNKCIRNCRYVILPYKDIKYRNTPLQILKDAMLQIHTYSNCVIASFMLGLLLT